MRSLVLVVTGLLIASFSLRAVAEPPDFGVDVLPILREHCFECHSHAHQESAGGLMLDSMAAMRTGGARGPSLIDDAASDPGASLLMIAIGYDDSDLQMPPDEKMPADVIEVLRRWIAAGAHSPESFKGKVGPKASRADPAEHWAYQPLLRPNNATGSDDRNPIDAILDEQRRTKGIEASEPAAGHVLLRRLSYDIVGLPPTYTELQAASETSNVGKFADSALDRLLASEQFGERWARHWMDVARYADNKGYVFEEDREYPEAYRYRDWLIAAFNQDLPYNRFVELQLAADLVADARPEDIAALGFLTLGRRFLNNVQDIIDDRIDVTARGLMGMTLACARCHDHKYDPITQHDYYSMYGVFLNSHEPGGEPWPHRLADKDKMQDAFVLIRGQRGNRGDKVPRRFVSFLSSGDAAFTGGSGRLELAGRIASAENPLTARVMANRVWLHLMGDSLVDTPSDFGIRCPEPSQRLLLDTLAARLIDSGWSVKALIRFIASSETYRQQSLARPGAEAIDPENSLYARMNRKRLDFESLRDTWLFAAGALDATIFGPSQKLDAEPFSRRRTVYSYIDRQNLPAVFRTFDMASPDTHVARRAQTSVPQQGLYMLNSRFVSELAQEFSVRMKAEVPQVDDQPQAEDVVRRRIVFAFQHLLGRDPNADELSSAGELVRTASETAMEARYEAWSYGLAKLSPDASELTGFQRLPHFTGSAWQGGPKLPDEQTGWCMLNAIGGHPGNDLSHCAVRRWTAAQDGQISVRGNLTHPSESGDGVRGTVFVSKRKTEADEQPAQQCGQWLCPKESVPTHVESIDVQAGDYVDFVVDCIGGPSHDSFQWRVEVQYRSGKLRSRSDADLAGPPPEPLDAWAVLAQALLTTNELAFVD